MHRYLLAAFAIVTNIVTNITATAGVNPNGPDLPSAVAKCTALGYANLPGHMAACVRAMRADYCGDGTAHTIPGTPINLYDRIGIQHDKADWQPEAEWTSRGASCVSSVAVMRHSRDPLACAVPIRPSCGMATAIAVDTAIITERKDP